MQLRQSIQSVLGLMFLVSSSFAFSNAEFTYNIIDGGIEFTGCVDECPSDLVIPAAIDGYAVISIVDEAFYVPEHGDEGYDEFASVLTSLTLPNTIRYIGQFAFAGNSISNLIIPSSIREIGLAAFNGCELDTLVIENGVQYLREAAFYHNNLTNVIIPESVIEIGRTVFSRNQLVEITIPKNVTSIGDRAFENNELVTINFSGNRPEIYQNIFFDTNTTFMGNQIQNIHYCSGASGWPGEPIEGITPELDDSCEYNPPQVTYKFMEEGIEITGCFDECPSDLVIPEEIDGYKVTGIGNGAFENSNFSVVTLPSGIERVGSYAFSQNQLTNVTIPDSVSYIGDRAFADNQLTTVTFSDSVKIIGDGAFQSNQLTSVTIPDNVTTIGYAAFADNQLNTVTIGNSVTSIRERAFAANQLTSVSVPGRVSFLGRYAFRFNQLTNLIFSGEPPTIGNNAFSNNSLTSITYCKDEHGQWDGVIIEGITPQLDENCFGSTTEYSILDIDQSGSVDALTDCLILLRYFFGLRSDNLINGAIATDANRTTAEDIEAHIQSLLP